MESVNNSKFKKIVSTAHALFMKHGIRRVSVEEICAEAEISKMTFYKYFKNKIELTKYILNQLSAREIANYRMIMKKQIPFKDKVKYLIHLKNKQTYMISEEFLNDLSKNPIPELVELLSNLRAESLKELLHDVKIARANGEIRKDIKPEFILYILKQMTEMNKDENLLQLYNSCTEVNMELTNFFFHGIRNNRGDLNH